MIRFRLVGFLGFPSRALGWARWLWFWCSTLAPAADARSPAAVTGWGPAFTMDGVMDTRLVGYWSDKNLYLGGMKAADIAFRPDGIGWALGLNAGGGFVILRFTWHAAERRQLTLDLGEELSGTWHREGRTYRHRVTSQNACDTKIVLEYEIRRGRDVLGRPATLLEAGQRISPGVIGDRFAFERELARGPDTCTIEYAGRCGTAQHHDGMLSRAEDQVVRFPWQAREYERICQDRGYTWRVPRQFGNSPEGACSRFPALASSPGQVSTELNSMPRSSQAWQLANKRTPFAAV